MGNRKENAKTNAQGTEDKDNKEDTNKVPDTDNETPANSEPNEETEGFSFGGDVKENQQGNPFGDDAGDDKADTDIDGYDEENETPADTGANASTEKEQMKKNELDIKKNNEGEPDKTASSERFSQQESVLVSLKHPQGIVFTMPDNRRVLVNGNAAHLRGLKKGILPSGGFGLTTVSRDDWDYIKKTYGSMSIFKNGLIFAGNDYASATDMQKDYDEIKSGMEPVSVGNESPVEELRKVDKASVKDS